MDSFLPRNNAKIKTFHMLWCENLSRKTSGTWFKKQKNSWKYIFQLMNTSDVAEIEQTENVFKSGCHSWSDKDNPPFSHQSCFAFKFVRSYQLFFHILFSISKLMSFPFQIIPGLIICADKMLLLQLSVHK